MSRYSAPHALPKPVNSSSLPSLPSIHQLFLSYLLACCSLGAATIKTHMNLHLQNMSYLFSYTDYICVCVIFPNRLRPRSASLRAGRRCDFQSHATHLRVATDWSLRVLDPDKIAITAHIRDSRHWTPLITRRTDDATTRSFEQRSPTPSSCATAIQQRRERSLARLTGKRCIIVKSAFRSSRSCAREYRLEISASSRELFRDPGRRRMRIFHISQKMYQLATLHTCWFAQSHASSQSQPQDVRAHRCPARPRDAAARRRLRCAVRHRLLRRYPAGVALHARAQPAHDPARHGGAGGAAHAADASRPAQGASV